MRDLEEKKPNSGAKLPSSAGALWEEGEQGWWKVVEAQEEMAHVISGTREQNSSENVKIHATAPNSGRLALVMSWCARVTNFPKLRPKMTSGFKLRVWFWFCQRAASA